MSPLSLLIAGPAADLFGIQSWFVMGGAVTLVLGLSGFFIPQVLFIEERARKEETSQIPEDLTLQETAA
jgi:hypothetical protein